MNEFDKVFKLYDQMKTDGLRPTFEGLNAYIESAIKIQKIDRIVEALREYKKQSKIIDPPKYLKS